MTIVVKYRMLSKLIPDCNPYCTSNFFPFVSILSCKCALSTSYHPQTDSLTECMHYSIKEVLHCFIGST